MWKIIQYLFCRRIITFKMYISGLEGNIDLRPVIKDLEKDFKIIKYGEKAANSIYFEPQLSTEFIVLNKETILIGLKTIKLEDKVILNQVKKGLANNDM